MVRYRYPITGCSTAHLANQLSVLAQQHAESTAGCYHIDECQRASRSWQCLVVWHANELLILTVTWRLRPDDIIMFPNEPATDTDEHSVDTQLTSVQSVREEQWCANACQQPFDSQ